MVPGIFRVNPNILYITRKHFQWGIQGNQWEWTIPWGVGARPILVFRIVPAIPIGGYSGMCFTTRSLITLLGFAKNPGSIPLGIHSLGCLHWGCNKNVLVQVSQWVSCKHMPCARDVNGISFLIYSYCSTRWLASHNFMEKNFFSDLVHTHTHSGWKKNFCIIWQEAHHWKAH